MQNAHKHQFTVEAIGRMEMLSYRSQILHFNSSSQSHLQTHHLLKTFQRLAGKILQGTAPRTLSTSSFSVENENSPSLTILRFPLKIHCTRAPQITKFN